MERLSHLSRVGSSNCSIRLFQENFQSCGDPPEETSCCVTSAIGRYPCLRPILKLFKPSQYAALYLQGSQNAINKKQFDSLHHCTDIGFINCVGATHMVRVADLKPARKVIKAQRRARKQMTQTQPANTDDVLDVE